MKKKISKKYWTKVWPSKPGAYWFYGCRFKKLFEDKFELNFVEVRKTLVKEQLVYIIHGHFLCKEEANGWWMEIDVPPLPKKMMEKK